uniref:Uncharacterized protein n=1 Tax=Tanacetum cinerariifolium TaxID=118510 RepID=A0A699JIU9_TANCI|nr:hypothetical protein [Tanacetum cinerariifolium]
MKLVRWRDAEKPDTDIEKRSSWGRKTAKQPMAVKTTSFPERESSAEREDRNPNGTQWRHPSLFPKGGQSKWLTPESKGTKLKI